MRNETKEKDKRGENEMNKDKKMVILFLFFLPIFTCEKEEVKKVIPRTIPKAILIASPNSGIAPLFVQFKVALVPEVDAKLYVFYFGDGESEIVKDGMISHVYRKGGEFSASVSIYFDDGSYVTTTTKITAVRNAPFEVSVRKNRDIIFPDESASLFIEISDPEGDDVYCYINGKGKKFPSNSAYEIEIRYPELQTGGDGQDFYDLLISDFILPVGISCEDEFGRGITKNIFPFGKDGVLC